MTDFGPLFLPLLSIGIAFFGVAGTVGFVIVFIGNRNRGLAQTQSDTSEAQNNTITALEAQIRAQDAQIKALEKKVARCEGVMSTIQYTLKERRKLRLEVKDDFVTLIDERTGAEITVPIHTSGQLEKEKEA